MDSVEERLRRLFRGNTQCYGQYIQNPDGSKRRAWTAAGPATDVAWDRHVAGEEVGIGISPITAHGTCHWGCIDLDDDDTDHTGLVERIQALQLPLVVCRSKSGGAHIFLFTLEPVAAAKIVSRLMKWSKLLNLENPLKSKGKRPDLEIFPKQLKIEEGQQPNWLNIPYFNAGNTNRFGFGDDGTPLSLADFVRYAEGKRQSELQTETKRVNLPVFDKNFFADGPPCLGALHQDEFIEGTRNKGIFNVGLYLKKRYAGDWEEKLDDYNQNSGSMTEPLPDDEMKGMIRSLRRAKYSYSCSEEPLKDECKPEVCANREFGVGAIKADHVLDNMPEFGQLIEHKHADTRDPSTFELPIGDYTVLLTPEQLRSVTKFTVLCFEQWSILVPSMKQATWQNILEGLLKDCMSNVLPKDAGPIGVFRFHLNEFLQTRERSDAQQDIIMGKPWEDGGKVYFRNISLGKWLKRHDCDFDLQRAFMDIADGGGGTTMLKIAGQDVNVWWMPATSVTEFTEDMEVKKHDAPEF
tara:strand:+ start:4466 stop:6034 length:1569 start_codon:yes stop_codon:yes gene_type:complete